MLLKNAGEILPNHQFEYKARLENGLLIYSELRPAYGRLKSKLSRMEDFLYK